MYGPGMEATGGLRCDELFEVNPATRPNEDQWISCLMVMSRLKTRVCVFRGI
jgi:hypothetical protein